MPTRLIPPALPILARIPRYLLSPSPIHRETSQNSLPHFPWASASSLLVNIRLPFITLSRLELFSHHPQYLPLTSDLFNPFRFPTPSLSSRTLPCFSLLRKPHLSVFSPPLEPQLAEYTNKRQAIPIKKAAASPSSLSVLRPS